MGYVLTEEQQFLKDAAQDLYKKVPVAAVRDMRDANDANGFSTKLWQEMVESGWPGVAVSEEKGGLNFGIRSLGILMEESGKTLTASPLLSTVVSAMVVEKYGSDAHQNILTGLVEGSTTVALALQEGNFYNPNKCTTGISNDNHVLNGAKSMVADAHIAEHIIISAATSSGNVLALVKKDTPGVNVENDFLMDSRYYCRVNCTNVAIQESDILVSSEEFQEAIDHITNWSNALLSAELVGIMSEAFERTVDYIKERRQFDRNIGSFQALQHRAADLYGEIEIAKSITIKALDAIDAGHAGASALCSMAKVKCSKVSQLATNEGVQMFGGIGMTDDEEIGFFMKRARVATQQYGGRTFHTDRFAISKGY